MMFYRHPFITILQSNIILCHLVRELMEVEMIPEEREVDLLPCPLCSGEAKFNRRFRGKRSYIGCINCLLRTPYSPIDKYIVDLWNTRKQPTDCPIRRVYEKWKDKNMRKISDDYDFLEDLWQAVKEELGEK